MRGGSKPSWFSVDLIRVHPRKSAVGFSCHWTYPGGWATFGLHYCDGCYNMQLRGCPLWKIALRSGLRLRRRRQGFGQH